MIASFILAAILSIAPLKTADILPWYGPGFYNKRTACGQVMTRRLVGVAHRTAKCGTKYKLYWKGRSIIVTVVDRGPYPSRNLYDNMPFDLTAGAAKALGCDCDNPHFTRHDVKYKRIY